MRKLLLVLSLLMAATLAVPAMQSSMNGEWLWTMPGPDGNPVDATLSLATDAGKLTGTFLFGGSRKLQIEEGTVDGNKLKFTIKRERPNGGSMVYRMSGTVEGESMKGTAETDMDGTPVSIEWTAKRK